MRWFISALLTFLLICPVLSSQHTSTRTNPTLQQRIRATAAEKARVKAVYAKRQTSFAQIQARRSAKDAVKLVRRACAAIIYGPQISGKVYPRCQNSLGLGYAKYPGWDLGGNDLPGNPVYPTNRTEAGCIQACNNYANTPDNTCVGAVMPTDAGVCYLKNKNLCAGTWNANSGFQAELKGGCGAWEGLVPTDVQAVCCEN